VEPESLPTAPLLLPLPLLPAPLELLELERPPSLLGPLVVELPHAATIVTPKETARKTHAFFMKFDPPRAGDLGPGACLKFDAPVARHRTSSHDDA
jgi:hypothetical protein